MQLTSEQRTLLEKRLAELEAPAAGKSAIGKVESGIAGAGQGFSLNFGDEALAALAAPVAYAGSRLAGAMGATFKPDSDYSKIGIADIYRMERDKTRQQLKSAQETNPGSYLAGYIGGAVASPVKFKGGTIAQAGKYGAAASLGESEADSLLGMATDTVKGGATGLATGGVLKAAGKIAKPVSDKSISATRKAAATMMKKIGIDDLTPGQLTGNRALQTTEAVMDDMLTTAGAARAKKEGQLRKFTAAALEKAGIRADEITPAVREQAESRFSDAYRQMTKGRTVALDQPVMKTVADIEAKQLDKLPTTVKPVIKSYLKDIKNAGGKLSGEAYQETRSALTNQARSLTNSDPFTANVLRSIRNALDEAAERSLPAAEKGAWRNLNNQYRNYKVIQKAATTASQDSLEGILSPSALLRAVETANKTKSQKGYGDLYDLARSSKLLLADSIPNSGTAQRQLAQRILTLGAQGAGVGGATYVATGDPETAALATAGGLFAAPKLAQKALNSRAAQSYFTKGIPGLGNISPAVKQAITRGAATTLGGSTASDASEPPPPAPPSQGISPEMRQLLEKRLLELESAPATPPATPQSQPAPQSSLFDRVIQQESRGRQFDDDGRPLTSPKGAVGVAQIMPKTAPEAAKLAGLPWDAKRYREDPEYNAALGKAYLDKQMETFGGDETLALMAYNWGPGNVKLWLKSGAKPERIPAETQQYLKNILGG